MTQITGHVKPVERPRKEKAVLSFLMEHLGPINESIHVTPDGDIVIDGPLTGSERAEIAKLVRQFSRESAYHYNFLEGDNALGLTDGVPSERKKYVIDLTLGDGSFERLEQKMIYARAWPKGLRCPSVCWT